MKRDIEVDHKPSGWILTSEIWIIRERWTKSGRNGLDYQHIGRINETGLYRTVPHTSLDLISDCYYAITTISMCC